MFFVLSKVLWFVVQPLTLVVLLLVLGLVLWLFGRRRAGFSAALLGTLILVVAAFTNLGTLALLPLENRFERPAPPADVAGIIVLGGGMDLSISAARGSYELNRAGDRFVEALRLARLFPTARIVLSGGSSDLFPNGETEAAAAARFFADFGIGAERLVMEGASRNTEENAAFVAETVAPAPGDTWLLVTSAFHMPRAVGLFRAVGFPVVPWPADRWTAGDEGFAVAADRPVENLSLMTRAMREWLGLAVYWMTGRIAEVFPGPP